MIKFRIEGEEFLLPDYISIENYVKIFKVKELFTDQYFAAKLLNIVSEAPTKLLMESEYEEINYLASYVLSLIPLQNPQFIDRFELRGIKYGFFPSWQELTFAEFIDMDTLATKKGDEFLNNVHLLLAIMYRPILEETSQYKYKIEEYNVNTLKERSELFRKHLDVKYLLGAQFFFIQFARKYSNLFQGFLIPNLSLWQKIKIIWMSWRIIYKIASRKPMDGSILSTKLHKMILQNMITSSRKM